MKVLIFNSLYEPYMAGGAERSVRVTAEALRPMGVEPVIVSTSDRDDVAFVGGLKVYYRKIPNLYWMRRAGEEPGWKKPLWHTMDARNPLASSVVAKILADEKPDLIHTNNLSGFSVRVWDVAARAKVPVVHTIRDHYLLCLATTMFRNGRRCERQCFPCRTMSRPKRWASESVRAVVGISRSILDSHLSLGFFPQAAVKTCIYNPITPVSDHGERKHDRDRCVFAYLGQLDRSKGTEFLLEKFQAAAIEGAELRLFGRANNAAYERELRGRFESETIRFMGFCPADEIYPQIDVAVVPSLRDEAFGRIVPEANAFGIPVLVSNRGGLAEIVENGKNGFTFDPDKPGEMEERLACFAGGYDRIDSMASACRAAASEFGAEKIAARYFDLYRKVLTTKGGASK